MLLQTVVGLRDLHEGEYVSVWVYNNADQEYTMYGSLYNSSFAHLFLLAAFRSNYRSTVATCVCPAR